MYLQNISLKLLGFTKNDSQVPVMISLKEGSVHFPRNLFKHALKSTG